MLVALSSSGKLFPDVFAYFVDRSSVVFHRFLFRRTGKALLEAFQTLLRGKGVELHQCPAQFVDEQKVFVLRVFVQGPGECLRRLGVETAMKIRFAREAVREALP
jgi:hypothetical protein